MDDKQLGIASGLNQEELVKKVIAASSAKEGIKLTKEQAGKIAKHLGKAVSVKLTEDKTTNENG